jgi:hypothetical protein
VDNLSIAMAQALLKLAETLVKTRDEMRETIDRMDHLRKVVDDCANTLIDTLKEALLIVVSQDASDEDGDEVEQPVVDRSSTQGEGSVGSDSEHEKRDEI